MDVIYWWFHGRQRFLNNCINLSYFLYKSTYVKPNTYVFMVASSGFQTVTLMQKSNDKSISFHYEPKISHIKNVGVVYRPSRLFTR